MTEEKRKEVKETFKALEEMVLQEELVKSIATTFKLMRLLAEAKDCLHELDENPVPVSPDEDFRFDIARVIDGIENCLSEIMSGRDGGKWLDTARAMLRDLNEYLKCWEKMNVITNEEYAAMNSSMLDLSTATGEEIIEKAKRVLTILRNNKKLPSGVALDLTAWLFAFGIRLSNDAKGVPLMTEEEIQKEIKRWAELV